MGSARNSHWPRSNRWNCRAIRKATDEGRSREVAGSGANRRSFDSRAGFLNMAAEIQDFAGKTLPNGRVRRANLPKMLNAKTGPVFLVPSGKFIFGSDDPEPPTNARKSTCRISTWTRRRYRTSSIASCGGHDHQPPDSPPVLRPEPSLPVVGVTLQDAKDYCGWAGQRVPTEQEWKRESGARRATCIHGAMSRFESRKAGSGGRISGEAKPVPGIKYVGKRVRMDDVSFSSNRPRN